MCKGNLVTGPFHVRQKYQTPATNVQDARFDIIAAILLEYSCLQGCVALGLVFSHVLKDHLFCLKEEGRAIFF
jgi:hypothetical protein